MDKLLYLVARTLLALVQSLPLNWVARLGRACGGLAYHLDKRHRRVATINLTHCFGKEKSAAEIRALARENFRRIGENYACAIKTAGMSQAQLRPHLSTAVQPGTKTPLPGAKTDRVIIAVGHFGNFEVFARESCFTEGWQIAATYRGLRQPSLDRLLLSMRTRSSCLFFERRKDMAALKAALLKPGICLGLLADQHAISGGVRVPFLGHDCATSPAPAVLARRYKCRLFTAVCFRTALAKWCLEFGPEIPLVNNGKHRPVEDIMRDVNDAFSAAVRRDPANWFWVHNRWRVANASE